MSDSDSDGEGPPPPARAGTGLYRRLTLSSGVLASSANLNSSLMRHSPSSNASPMSKQSSFQWDACQSFRLYANQSRSALGASRRGTQHYLAELDHIPIPASPAAELKTAFKALKDYILLFGTVTVSAESELPINIRKGKLIGSGGFADVYSGINIQTGELVAIKEIRISDTSNRNQLKAVGDEFTLLRQLRHPNVVRYILFEQSVSQKMCRIVMEFMAGGSAQGLLQKFGPLNEQLVRKFATDMLQGIAFIHREGIIHRDIKPANILVSATGQVKLADFGCSKRITEINTGTSCIIGTPVYMAPEFIRGETTAKADIWAMGATIFELVVGLPLWHHTKVKDHLPLMFYITTTSESPLVIPQEDERQFSNNFIDFLDKCFTRDPRKRPDADELLRHPWIVEAEESAQEVQREIESVTYVQSVELCHTLSTEALQDTREVDSASSTPRVASFDASRADGDNPDESPPRSFGKDVAPSSGSSSPNFGAPPLDSGMLMSSTTTASNGAFEKPQPAGQYLLLNQETGNLEFAACGSNPTVEEEEAAGLTLEHTTGPFLQVTPSGGRSTTKRQSSVVFLSDGMNNGSSDSSIAATPSPWASPQALDGPVHMSFSFRGDLGEKVSVGLQIQPEDVTCRIVDRKPSFVVAMNENIRGQLTSAMMQLSRRSSCAPIEDAPATSDM